MYRGQFDADAAAFDEPLNVPPQGTDQSRLVEQRRMQHVRECPDFLQRLITELVRFRNQRLCLVRFEVTSLQAREVHVDQTYVLRCYVMQLSRDPPPLGVLEAQQVSRQPLQLQRRAP